MRPGEGGGTGMAPPLGVMAAVSGASGALGL